MIVVATIRAKEDKGQQMEHLLKEMVEKVKTETGTLTYTLHRSTTDPCTFMFYEKYTDMNAFTAHSQTLHFQKLFEDLKPLLAAQPEIAMFTEIAGIG